MIILQDITYLNLKFSVIKDVISYFKGSKYNSLKTLYNNIKITFGINSSNIVPSVSEINNVYKFALKVNNSIFGFVIFIPEDNRIDLYTSENVNVPMVQIKNKKIVYKSYPLLLDKLGIEQLIKKLYTSM